MIVLVEQLLVLLCFAVIGFVLSRFGIVKEEHSSILSRLLVYVFLPSNIIRTFAKNCTVAYVSQHYLLVLISLGIVLVLGIGARIASKTVFKRSPDAPIFEYSLVIPNFGYLGYALTESVFGASGLMDAMMFAMPLSLYAYTVGFCILSGKKLSPKSLLNPTMIALVIGVILGVSGLGGLLPEITYTLLDKASACMAPVSMLLFGIVLSDFGLPSMLKDKRTYGITALRLVLIPLLIGDILTLVGAPVTAIRTALMLYCLPCGLNTVVFVKSAGGNCQPGAALSFVSTILCPLTIPLILLLFGIRL